MELQSLKEELSEIQDLETLFELDEIISDDFYRLYEESLLVDTEILGTYCQGGFY